MGALREQLTFTLHYMQNQSQMHGQMHAKKLEHLMSFKEKCKEELETKKEELESHYSMLCQRTKDRLQCEKNNSREKINKLKKQLRVALEEKQGLLDTKKIKKDKLSEKIKELE